MKRKILFGFLLISLQSFMVGGGTMAYFTSEAPLASTSAFQFSTVDIKIVETDGLNCGGGDQSQKAEWTITNTGGQDVQLRVLVTSTLEIEETEGLTADADPPTVDLEPGKDWALEADGYYHYNNILPVNQLVQFSLTLIESGGDPGTYNYNLDIEAQALQTVNNPMWEDVIIF